MALLDEIKNGGSKCTCPSNWVGHHHWSCEWEPDPADVPPIDQATADRIEALFYQKLEAAEGPDHPWVKRWHEKKQARS